MERNKNRTIAVTVVTIVMIVIVVTERKEKEEDDDLCDDVHNKMATSTIRMIMITSKRKTTTVTAPRMIIPMKNKQEIDIRRLNCWGKRHM